MPYELLMGHFIKCLGKSSVYDNYLAAFFQVYNFILQTIRTMDYSYHIYSKLVKKLFDVAL